MPDSNMPDKLLSPVDNECHGGAVADLTELLRNVDLCWDWDV